MKHPVCKSSSPPVDQSVTRLTTSWVCQPIIQLPKLPFSCKCYCRNDETWF